jgi:hypothetical protein
MATTPVSSTWSIRVVSVHLRVAACQLDVEGVAVHSGLPQNAGESAYCQVLPVERNNADHGS